MDIVPNKISLPPPPPLSRRRIEQGHEASRKGATLGDSQGQGEGPPLRTFAAACCSTGTSTLSTHITAESKLE